MESIFDIQQKEDSLKKLQEVKNIDAKYLLSAKEINIIVSTIKNLMDNIGSVNTLDEVLEAGGYSERSATVGNFRAKEIQVGESFIPESSGALFRIQKNSDGTISIVFDSVSQTDSDNFGRLTATLSNNDGVEFRHLENDNSQGVIARIRKDGVLFTLINSWLKVNKDGVYRDVMLSGLAEIADVIGLQNNLDNKADLVEGLVPQAQSQGSSLTMDSSTYKIEFKDARGEIQVIDLPIESLFKDANYNSDTKKLSLTLDSGSIIEVSLEDLVDLPEIQIEPGNPAVLPSEGKKVYFNYSNGKVYLNIGGNWEFFGNTITDTQANNLLSSYIHSQIISGNPHGTKLVQLLDYNNALMSSISADSSLLFQNQDGIFYRLPWENVNRLIAFNDFNIRRKGTTIYDDMLSTTNSDFFIKGSFNSGTIAQSTTISSENNPGVLTITSTVTSANGGGNIIPANTSTPRGFAFGVGSKFDVIVRTASLAGTVNMRFGIIAGTVNPTQPTDGVYFTLTNNSLIGQTANSSVRSSTAAFTSIASDTWYHFRVIVTSSTLATYQLYDMNGSLLWSDTLTTNLPTIGTGVQPTFIAYNTVAESRQLAHVDYISYTYPQMNRGALT